MVRFQVIDLFAEENCPEVFADEFYGFEGGLGAGFGVGETSIECISIRREEYEGLDMDMDMDFGLEESTEIGARKGMKEPTALLGLVQHDDLSCPDARKLLRASRSFRVKVRRRYLRC